MRFKETYRIDLYRLFILLAVLWAWAIIILIGYDVYEWALRGFR